MKSVDDDDDDDDDELLSMKMTCECWPGRGVFVSLRPDFRTHRTNSTHVLSLRLNK